MTDPWGPWSEWERTFGRYGVAVAYLLLVVYAQQTCSMFPSFGNQCHGPEGDVWMLPFFLAPIGIPMIITSIAALVSQWRRSRTGSR